MTVQNIMKVADISQHEVSAEFKEWLISQHSEWAYQDSQEELNENLYSPEYLSEMWTEEKHLPSRQIINELDQISALCNENDCSYFRIIKD